MGLNPKSSIEFWTKIKNLHKQSKVESHVSLERHSTRILDKRINNIEWAIDQQAKTPRKSVKE